MINRLGKTSNIIGIVAMDELVINGFVGNLAKAVDGESIAIACDVTCGVDVRVVTEKEVLLGPPPKTFDVELGVAIPPPVKASVFAFKLSLVFSFITKVLFASAHNSNAFTAGCGATPCIAAK